MPHNAVPSRWYPSKGTRRFWEKLANECAAAAVEAAGPSFSLELESWICCDQGPDGCSVCAAALEKDSASDGPSTSTALPAAVHSSRSAMSASAGSAVLMAVGTYAARMGQEVLQEICKMPAVSGQMPDMFAALNDLPQDKNELGVECIELIG